MSDYSVRWNRRSDYRVVNNNKMSDYSVVDYNKMSEYLVNVSN